MTFDVQIKSAQDDRLLSANDVINLIFKMAPRLKRGLKGCIARTDSSATIRALSKKIRNDRAESHCYCLDLRWLNTVLTPVFHFIFNFKTITIDPLVAKIGRKHVETQTSVF